MKPAKRIRYSALILTLLFASINGLNTRAEQLISDVSTGHWAYTYIIDVLDRQLMGLTDSGQFNPNDLIDKFETCRILARMLGYKYESPTPEEQRYYDNAYQRYQGILTSYASSFPSKWNNSANREIAFLLAKEVLNEEDMYQFVIKDQSENEVLRALSREEAVVFLTRVAGKKSEALSLSYTYDFSDDASINPSYKQYVYYYKARQIIVGEDGKFSPKTGVTRATLAVLISKTALILGDSLPNTRVGGAPTTIPASSPSVSLESLSGTIDMLFADMNALQILTSSGNKDIYKLSQLATITINDVPSGFGALQARMPVTCTLSGGELTVIKAQNTIATPVPQAPTEPTPTPLQNETRTIEGIVTEAEGTASGMQIKVERNVVSPRGEITSEILGFVLPPDCSIKRGDATVTFWDIEKGEIVKITENGGIALSLVLEEKHITIESGTLLEKRFVDSTMTPYLVIQGINGRQYELRVTESTRITRGIYGDVTYDKLRLGDIVDARAEYDQLTIVEAYGVSTTVDGVIENILITRKSSSITIRTVDNVSQTYTVIPGSVDIYSVRLNDNVRLRLDSLEIEGVTILQTTAN